MLCSPSLRSDSSTWIPVPASFLSRAVISYSVTFSEGWCYFLSLPPHSSFLLYPPCFFCEMKESSKEIRITVRMSKEESQLRGGRIRKAFNCEWMLSDGSHVSALRVEHNEAEEKTRLSQHLLVRKTFETAQAQQKQEAINSRWHLSQGVNFSCTTLWREGEEPDSTNRWGVMLQPLLMFAQLHNLHQKCFFCHYSAPFPTHLKILATPSHPRQGAPRRRFLFFIKSH